MPRRPMLFALGAALVAATGAVVCLRPRPRVAPPPPPPSAPAPPSLYPTPSPPPTRTRHDSVRVPLPATSPRESFWQMHESSPLVSPDTEPRPVTILLHGMCADSSWQCDWLQYFDMAPQWQLCPRGPSRCGGDGFSWGGPDVRRVVERTLATAEERNGPRIRDDAVVLAGFSQGAYAIAGLVADLARAPSPTLHVRGIVLQGAKVELPAVDVRALRLRVALTAGDLDAAAPAMRAEAERLRRAGIDVRYESLGADEGHFASVSTGRTVAKLIDWCRAE